MLASTQQGALQGQGWANRLVMQHIIMMMISSEWFSLCFWGKMCRFILLFPLQQRNTSEYCTGLALNAPQRLVCHMTSESLWAVWPDQVWLTCESFMEQRKTNPNCQIIKRILLKREQQTFTGSWKLQETSADGRKVRTYKLSPQTCVLFWRCVPLHACWVVLAQDWSLLE